MKNLPMLMFSDGNVNFVLHPTGGEGKLRISRNTSISNCVEILRKLADFVEKNFEDNDEVKE